MNIKKEIVMGDERRATLQRELDEIGQKLEDLEIPTYMSGLGFRSGSKLITVALKDQANTTALNAIASKLEHFKKEDCPISEEALGWLGAACDNLDQFSEYCNELVDVLYARMVWIEHELNSTEQTQSEMDKEEGVWLNKQR